MNSWAVTPDQFLTQAEILTLYKALRDAKDLAIQRQSFFCHIRDYFILRILLESGLRSFELAALRISDIRGGSLIVQKGKGGKRRSVLLTKETQRVLADLMKVKIKVLREPVNPSDFLLLSERRGPYSTRGLRKRVKFWFGKIGLSKDLSVHSCRHSYVSHMLAAGGPLVTVRDNAGHSSLAITSIYSHALKTDLGDIELFSSEKT